MKKYYLIPTWALVIIAAIANDLSLVFLALFLSGLQSFQLIMYANDMWLLKKVKLVVFSFFSFKKNMKIDERERAEKEYIKELQSRIEFYQSELDSLDEEYERKASQIVKDYDLIKTMVVNEMVTKKAEALKEREQILQQASMEAEAKVKEMLESRAPKIYVSPNYLIENNTEAAKIEAANLYLKNTASLPKSDFVMFNDDKNNFYLQEFIKSELEQIDYMEGFDFERYCKIILSEIGFDNVMVTRQSGDYGVDLLADKDFASYAIQCKRYYSNVGSDAVQEIFAGRNYYHKDIAVVITNSRFTDHAIQMAQETNVRLWDRDMLTKFIALTYFKSLMSFK